MEIPRHHLNMFFTSSDDVIKYDAKNIEDIPGSLTKKKRNIDHILSTRELDNLLPKITTTAASYHQIKPAHRRIRWIIW